MKKAISVLAALILCIGLFSGLSVSAAKEVTLSFENASKWKNERVDTDVKDVVAITSDYVQIIYKSQTGSISISTDVRAYEGKQSLKIYDMFPDVRFMPMVFGDNFPVGGTIKFALYLPEGSPMVGIVGYTQNTKTWDQWSNPEVEGYDATKFNEWQECTVQTQNAKLHDVGFQIMGNGGDGSPATICYLDAFCIIDKNGKVAPLIDGREQKENDLLSIKFDKLSAELYPGETVDLTVQFVPDNATQKEYTLTSSNEEVATVDANGKVTAVGLGKASITATNEEFGYTTTAIITVIESPVKVAKVILDKTSINLKINKSDKLEAMVLSATGEIPDDTSITLSSSNEEVCTVTNTGEIKAKKPGTAIITVTTNDGGFTAVCEVKVSGNFPIGLVISAGGVLLIVTFAIIVFAVFKKGEDNYIANEEAE